MGLVGYLLLILLVSVGAFVLCYRSTQYLVVEGSVPHAFLVCFLIPFLIGSITLFGAEIAEPTTKEMSARIARGELTDPGPAAFVKWILSIGIPMMVYVALSIPLFIWAQWSRDND